MSTARPLPGVMERSGPVRARRGRRRRLDGLRSLGIGLASLDQRGRGTSIVGRAGMFPALVSFFAALLSVIFLPVVLRIQVHADGGITSLQLAAGLWRGLWGLGAHWRDHTWRLHLMLGRRRLRWPVWNLSTPPSDTGPPKARARRRAQRPTPQRPRGKAGHSRLRTLAVLWRPLLHLFRDALGSIRFHGATVHGMLGCADPACTGWLFGMRNALLPVPQRAVRMDLTPTFVQTGFHGSAEIVLHLRVHRLLWTVARAGLRILARRFRFRRRPA